VEIHDLVVIHHPVDKYTILIYLVIATESERDQMRAKKQELTGEKDRWERHALNLRHDLDGKCRCLKKNLRLVNDVLTPIIAVTKGNIQGQLKFLEDEVDVWRSRATTIVERITPMLDAIEGFAREEPPRGCNQPPSPT